MNGIKGTRDLLDLIRKRDSSPGLKVGFEFQLTGLVSAWHGYACLHAKTYGSRLGGDYVLFPQWEAIGEGLLGLLNGDTGILDCWELDSFVRDTIEGERASNVDEDDEL